MSSRPQTITLSSDSSSSVQFIEEVTPAEAFARSLPFRVPKIEDSPVNTGYQMTSSRDSLFSTRDTMPDFVRSSLSEISLRSDLSMFDLGEVEQPEQEDQPAEEDPEEEEEPEEEPSDDKEPAEKKPKI